MEYDSKEFIKKLYEARKPPMPFNHFYEICCSPFAYLKKLMAKKNVPDFRIQGLGRFVVDYRNAKCVLSQLKKGLIKKEGKPSWMAYTESVLKDRAELEAITKEFLKNYKPTSRRDKHVSIKDKEKMQNGKDNVE